MANTSDFYCQQNPRYKGSPLGKDAGGSDLFWFGCYYISLCRKLGVDPITFNQVLVSLGLWDNNNYLIVNQMAAKMPEIFAGFTQLDSFTMDDWGKWCADDNAIVVAKVSAKPIGGTGTHFVGEERRDGANAIIFDPWFGDIIKVADRYNAVGNLLSLRIFTLNPNWKQNIKKYLAATTPPSTGGQTMPTALQVYLGVQTDAEAITKLKEHLGEINGKCNWGAEGDQGGFLGSERKSGKERLTKISQLSTDLETVGNELLSVRDQLGKANDKVTETEGKLVQSETALTKTQEALTACENKPTTEPSLDGWELNGLTIQKQSIADGVTITKVENYKRKA